ncbi:MAG: histone deacetylase [Bryobacterales bacterium]|nr:histone deacetylase [Bryobacterales bacterium]
MVTSPSNSTPAARATCASRTSTFAISASASRPDLLLYYCDHHEIPLPPEHKFPMRKYRLARERLLSTGLFAFAEAPLAPREAIKRVHSPAYVQAFLEGTLSAAEIRRIGFPWSPALVTRTLASAGGTLAATRQALDTGIGGTLAGGTHHAFHDYGSGFCVFNDIAIAVTDCGLRAAIVDLDVHQGDGTAALLRTHPNVLTLSMHGRNNFPFRKQESDIDIELDDGVTDSVYLARLDQALPRVWDFKPQIVFYQSGVDALAQDRLGRLSLTLDGLARRDEMVLGPCRSLSIPVVITLGGGYAQPIELTAEAHADTFLTARRVFGPEP